MEIKMLNIEDLKPYENNPRINDNAVKYVANSIKEFGWKVPMVIDKNNVIVTGHTRYKAALELGYKQVPCIVADDLTEEQIKAFRLADNKVSEKSLWDEQLLDLEILNLDDKFDLNDFGFDILKDIEEINTEKINKRNIQSMEIKTFEHHDYVVFVFDNQMDWLNVVNRFGIKKVDAGYGETKKVGVGRVINGKRLLEEIGHQDSNIE